MDWLFEEIKVGIVNLVVWIGSGILNFFINYSYWICLPIIMISILLYVGGCKKGAKIASITFVIYVILQSLSLLV